MSADQAELDRHKSDLAAAEQERRRLQASVAEQSQRVQEETLEKQQLTLQLEHQHMHVLTLTSELRFLLNVYHFTGDQYPSHKQNRGYENKLNCICLSIIMN